MYCDACGAKVEDTQNFCGVCGKLMRAAPAPRALVSSREGRVAGHLRVLALLWLVRAALSFIPAMFLTGIRRWWFPMGMPEELHGFLYFVLGGIGWLLLLRVVLCVVAGWGLLDRAPWARVYTIVVGALSLIEFPIGTGLGIYSLWVLLPESSAVEYRQLAMQ